MFSATRNGDKRREEEVAAWMSIPIPLHMYFTGTCVGLFGLIGVILTACTRKEWFQPLWQVALAGGVAFVIFGMACIFFGCYCQRKGWIFSFRSSPK